MQRLDIEPQACLPVLNARLSVEVKEQTVSFMQKLTPETSAEPDLKQETETDRSIIKPIAISKYPTIAINSIESIHDWEEETPHKERSLSSSFITFEYSSISDDSPIHYKETKCDNIQETKKDSFCASKSSNQNNTDGTEILIKLPTRRLSLSNSHLFLRRRSLNLPLMHRLSRSNIKSRGSVSKDVQEYKQIDIGIYKQNRLFDKPMKKIQPLRKKFFK